MKTSTAMQKLLYDPVHYIGFAGLWRDCEHSKLLSYASFPFFHDKVHISFLLRVPR